MKKRRFFSALLVLGSFSCFAQDQHLIDSLLQVLKTDKADTNKLRHMYIIGREYAWMYAADSALYFSNAVLDLSDSLLGSNNDPKVQRRIYMTRAGAYNNIGNVYYDQGNYPEALKNHFAALRIREKINDVAGKAPSYNNIGLVYTYQGNNKEALRNYEKCLEIYTQLGDQGGIATTYNNIAIIYSDQGNFEEALKNHFASLKIKELLNDKVGIATSQTNIGVSYYAGGDYAKALEHQLIAMKMHEEVRENGGLALNYYNIGNISVKQKKYKQAREYYLRSVELSEKTHNTHNLRDAYHALTTLTELEGDYKGAFENLKKYVLYSDSLENEDTRIRTLQAQMSYDYEKKEAVAEIEHKKDLESRQVLSEEKSRKQMIILFFVLGSLVLLIVFSAYVFRSLRIMRKRKNIIELQKTLVEEQTQEVESQKILVEEKQKEVIDSINYARRIQRSQLPTEKYIEKNLKRLMNRLS